MSITLNSIPAPTQARANLTSADVIAFQALLGSANLITLPEGKTPADIRQFLVTVQPNGTGFLQIAVT